LASVGSVLSSDRFCPECDRDLAEELTDGEIVLCETCVARDGEAADPSSLAAFSTIRAPGQTGT
jgi:hypothetical protein